MAEFADAEPREVIAAAARRRTGLAPALALVASACGTSEAPTPGESALPDAPAAAAGETLFTAHCASCHEGGVAKAPHKMFLQMMTADALLAAMTDGLMAQQAAALSPHERGEIAEYLAGEGATDTAAAAMPPACEGEALAFDFESLPATAGWGIDRRNTRMQPAATAGVTRTDVATLEPQWAFAYRGAQRARSQPTAAGGAVYSGSQDGTVYALEAATGCVRWTFRASAEVRTAIVVSPWEAGDASARPALYFGDILAKVYAVDAVTGELRWVRKADDHPNATVTGTPVLFGPRLYVPVSSLEVTTAAAPDYPCCTFRGSVLALDADTGGVLWKTYTIADEPAPAGETRVGTPIFAPSGAPVWNSPTIDADRGRLYVGTGENYSSPAGDTSDSIIALDLESGAVDWVWQATAGDAWNVACMLEEDANCPAEDGPDVDFGSSPILLETQARSVLVAGQKSGDVYGLDPDQQGAVLWRRKVGRGGIQGGVHFGMAAAGNTVFVPISDLEDGEAHSEPARPGLYALDARTGELLWAAPADDVCGDREFCAPGISAAITATPDAVFAGHMDGRLRVYDARDGRVLAEFDTTQTFTTVSGERAHGGSIGGGGPLVANGQVVLNSGYGIYSHMPGNVLIAFSSSRD